MNRITFLGRNLKYFFSSEWEAQVNAQDQKLNERITAFEQVNDGRATAYEQTFDERISHYEKSLDERTAHIEKTLTTSADKIAKTFTERATQLEKDFAERAEHIEKAFIERADHFEQAISQRLDGYEKAVDERLDEREVAQRQWLETRFTEIELRLDEREAAMRKWLEERLTAVDLRLDEREKIIDTRSDTFETALGERLDNYETATTTRLNEHESAVTLRLDERDVAIDERLAAREIATDKRFDERIEQIELHLDERLAAHELATDQRAATFEAGLDHRIDERFVALELRGDERLSALELRGDDRFAKIEQNNDERLNELLRNFELRFDDRARLNDTHTDERLNKLERYIDERFVRLEKTSDSRMETHERRVDGKLKTNREDMIDRTDVMLQLFEQRLDQQRRALRALRDELARVQNPAAHAADAVPDTPLPELADVLQEAAPDTQVQSFRKLAEGYHLPAASKLPKAEVALYHRILDWKKVSHEGLNQYTADEQEVVNYILSFISDPAERHYTMQHMRRFLATLERIPPAKSSADRLLELGSLMHFVPALKKYTGYSNIVGADFWETPDRVSTEILKQIGGKDEHTFELHNFNVEADPFPFPDKHFRVVLCCELIEHLQRDPLHMLWECNRVLQDDGFLLLTTPNISSARSIEGILIACSPYLLSQYNRETPADQHNHEYAPYEVGVALAAAGFSVVALETDDVWLRSNPAILELLEQVELSTALRGDNIFALARKTSAPVERFPKELYVQ